MVMVLVSRLPLVGWDENVNSISHSEEIHCLHSPPLHSLPLSILPIPPPLLMIVTPAPWGFVLKGGKHDWHRNCQQLHPSSSSSSSSSSSFSSFPVFVIPSPPSNGRHTLKKRTKRYKENCSIRKYQETSMQPKIPIQKIQARELVTLTQPTTNPM